MFNYLDRRKMYFEKYFAVNTLLFSEEWGTGNEKVFAAVLKFEQNIIKGTRSVLGVRLSRKKIILKE